MRTMRRVMLTALVMTGAACGGGQSGRLNPGGGGGAGGAGGRRWTGTLGVEINRNVDVLFLIDDSSSMRLAQSNLERNFPVFMTTLASSPQGLPNLHIAVISSDMGAGDGSIAGCDALGGKQGIFQYTPRGTCTSSGLQAGATFIADIAGVRNYTGNLADVFTCIAALGESGCGFEHPFAAILRALGADGRAPPIENQGFLRPDAKLAIFMLTDEDDCSAAPGVPLFDTTSNTNIQSQLGPPANFRCNEFGHLCEGAHPNRMAPGNNVASMVHYAGCTSNDSEGYLLKVRDVASRLKALKADPSEVAFMAIHGPATPYAVTWKNPSTSDTSCGAASCPWPAMAHSCTGPDGSFADPGVRIAQLVREFGRTGLSLPTCVDSYGPSFQQAAMLIEGLLGPPCIPGPIGKDPQSGGLPDCKVTQRHRNDSGAIVDKMVPACASNSGVAPCWQLVTGPTCAGWLFDVSPDPSLPASGEVTITYDCAMCTAPSPSIDCI